MKTSAAKSGTGRLPRSVGRYAQVLIAQMMQSTACNAVHQVPQRCARWLLMTHDRMHEQDFKLSHEFLAVMLGVQRPTVSVIAGTLQEAGLIRYMHGRVTVRDAKGLEAASCECYPSSARTSTACGQETTTKVVGGKTVSSRQSAESYFANLFFFSGVFFPVHGHVNDVDDCWGSS